MGFYNVLAENMLHRSMDLISGSSISKDYKELKKTQWLNHSELVQMQNKRFVKLVNHTYENVPFYRKKWDTAGVKIDTIKSIDDITTLPIVCKKDMIGNFESLKSKDFLSFKSRLTNTGGSNTGEPFSYYLQRESWSMIVAAVVRGREWAGYRLGDKLIGVGASSIIPDKQSSFGKRMWKRLERQYGVSTLGLNPEGIDNYINFIGQKKIKYLRGYPSGIFVMAKHISDNNIEPPELKAIFTTSEVLNDLYRKTIESTFRVKVFDEYGVRDGGALAMECDAHMGLHLTEEKTITEIVDDTGTPLIGKIGDVVHTDLYNYAFPFIRYNVEDRGIISLDQCGCGRELPRFTTIEGRKTDIIKFSNGKSWIGSGAIVIFNDFDLRKYQLVETSKDNIRVLIIPGKTFNATEKKRLASVLEYNAGPGVTIEVDEVESIQETKSGKMKVIISKDSSTRRNN